MAMDLVKQYKAEMDRAKAELAETQEAQYSIDTVAGLLRKELDEEHDRKAELLAKLASLEKMYTTSLHFVCRFCLIPRQSSPGKVEAPAPHVAPSSNRSILRKDSSKKTLKKSISFSDSDPWAIPNRLAEPPEEHKSIPGLSLRRSTEEPPSPASPSLDGEKKDTQAASAAKLKARLAAKKAKEDDKKEGTLLLF